MDTLKELELACLKGVLTIVEASALYKRSKKRIRELCVNGKLICRQAGSTWLISKASLDIMWGQK